MFWHAICSYPKVTGKASRLTIDIRGVLFANARGKQD